MRAYACLLVVLMARTAAAQTMIQVERSIPDYSRDMVHAVASDIYFEVLGLFQGRPPLDLPIAIYHSSDLPITSLNDWSTPTEIRIGTTVTGFEPGQFAFQFSHEMGHVMLDPRRNNGFVDAVCAALALEVLSRLSVKWRTAPPLPPLRGVDLLSYRKTTESQALRDVPTRIADAEFNEDWATVTAYLRDHRQEIEPGDSPRYRTLQTLAALAILSKPVDWQTLRGIAACTEPDPKTDANFRVLPLRAGCLVRVRDIDCRIGSTCAP
jgi:hypothetical protein